MWHVQVSIARFIVHQYGFGDSFQITTNALTIIIEHAGHSRDITGSWITGNQLLNQLSGQERSDVRMIGNRVQGYCQILFGV